ncbi:hypothetical protein RJ641_000836 [Dillenia turbinata]|uniref:Agenet domain-containing protein n=1 Tax=Dillenia turbinata TaxID=194707 RepID=A0AAN8W726_9MAGN
MSGGWCSCFLLHNIYDLREILPAKQVRSNPPEIPAKGFSFLDQVDAFDNDGWWVGKITRITDSDCYVYLDTIREEIMYPFSQLRVHQEWIDREWISANKNRNREMSLWKQRSLSQIISAPSCK